MRGWVKNSEEEDEEESPEVACLEEQRIIILNGEINEKTSQKFLQYLLSLASQDPTKEITVYLSTYGGDAYDMMAMHDMIQIIQCPINTVAIGKVMSAGVLILAAGKKRTATPNTIIMMHQVSTEVGGSVKDLSIEISHVKALQEVMYKLYSKYTGKALKTIEYDLTHDKYLTATEAVEYGLIDEIVPSPGAKTKKSKKR